jgi:hypothetical protein
MDVAADELARQHFGAARLGDERRTKRLVKAAAHILRHPGGTLPTKLENWSELTGLYRLAAAAQVTHGAVLGPHRQRVLARMREQPDRVVLLIHDASELNYTRVAALHAQLGKVGSGRGKGRGYVAHHTLAVTPRREVLGLVNQTLHRRRDVPANEGRTQKRDHPGRESRLWVAGCDACGEAPDGCTWVDVADRGGDGFEFLCYEHARGRKYVIRSAKDRRLPDFDHVGDDRVHDHLHAYARDLPTLGTRTVEVPARAGTGKARPARVRVAAGPVTLGPNRQTRGEHDGRTLDLWVIHVREVDPPAPPPGVEPLEWILLSNLPAPDFELACRLIDFYACRPLIEDYHKGLKTGLGVERLQFERADRLEPVIALLSVVAALLLQLREAARRPDADVTAAAATLVPASFVRVLSAKLDGRPRDDLSVREFVVGVARLGGFLARKHDGLPGWQTLWRGWNNLHLLIEGASLLRGGP